MCTSNVEVAVEERVIAFAIRARFVLSHLFLFVFDEAIAAPVLRLFYPNPCEGQRQQ